MESRTLLSVSVHGTPGDDTISVSLSAGGSLVVDVNGTQTIYTPAQYVDGISIDTGSAHTFDTLAIAGLPATSTTVTSGGVLKATVGSNARGLQDIAATSLQLGGSTGTLQLTVEDSADSTAGHLILDTATNSGVTYDLLHGLTPGDIRAASSLLVMNLGDAGNTIDVNGTAPRPPAFAIVNLNTGNGDDAVNVNATTAGTILNVNGQNGHDSVSVTSTQSHHGVVNVNNPLGHTTLSVQNDTPQTSSGSLDTFTAAGATYGSLTGIGPGIVNFDGANMDGVFVSGGIYGIESLTVNNTPGGGEIRFSNTSASAVKGVAANQQLDIGNIFPGARGPVTVDFTTGRIMPGAQISTHVPELDVIYSASDPCTYGDAGAEHNGASVSNDQLDIENINFEGPSPGLPTKVIIAGNPFDFTAQFAPQVDVSGEAVFTDTAFVSHFGADLITLTAGPAPLTKYLEFAPNAGARRIDITNNEAKFDGVSATTLRDEVRTGLAGGNGITSSLANSHFGIGITDHGVGFAGNTVADVRYARYGDTNLDGKVDFSDVLIAAQNYGRTNAIWDQGDFNYDGTVNFADLLKLAQNFGGTTPAAAADYVTSVEMLRKARSR